MLQLLVNLDKLLHTKKEYLNAFPICIKFLQIISSYSFLEDHAIGLSTFTIMAGLGGSLGYAMGGLDWGVLGIVEF